jgi:putative peptide zinc metalloprotease protein
MPYVDASSAWVLRNKWRRVVVGAGGMYVELAIASIAAAVWANTSQGTIAHAISYNMMFIASVSTLLFNGNPLLRYDGYYILSDLLEIPNLAQRSKQYLYYLVKKYVYGVRQARSPAHAMGERFWFPAYGIASTIYRVFICTAILMFIADRFFLLGTLLAVGAIVTWVMVPLGTFLRYLFTSRELTRTRPRAILATLGFFLAVIIGIGLIRAPRRYRAEGIVEPLDMAVVYAEEDGFVENVLPTGTEVDPAGDALVTCVNPQLIARLEQLQAKRRELEVQRRISRRDRKEAEVQYLGHGIKAMDEQIKRTRKKIEALKIHAPQKGIWISPDAHRYQGMHFSKGKPLGIVADLSRMRIRATAGQKIAAPLIKEAQTDVEIRVKGRPDLELDGRILAIHKAGTKQLPSPALGFQAGGSVQTDMEDPKGVQAAERLFEIRIAPDPDAGVQLLGGQRVVVRFTLPSQPLVAQWYHALRQVIMKRFKI